MSRDTPVSLTVYEDGYPASYSSVQTTVGQALASRGVQLQEGDLVSPGPDEVLSPGPRVYISHAQPVNLVVAGEQSTLRTRGKTVGDVLAQAGVSLQSEDYVTPAAVTPVKPGVDTRG